MFAEVVRGGATGSDVTGSDESHVGRGPVRKYVLRKPDFLRVFVLTRVVVQVA